MNGQHNPDWRLTAVGISALFFAACFTSAGYSSGTKEEADRQPHSRPATHLADMVPAVAARGAKPIAEATPVKPERAFGDGDSDVLLRIAMAEAEGESTEGKALVMRVVLNRVQDPEFPDTVEEVVLQSADGEYQFSPAAPGGRYWTETPDGDCMEALRMIEDGWDKSEGALYFESCEGESWQSGHCEYLFTLGGHRFYR